MAIDDDGFTMECYFNEFLPEDGTDVDVILTVACKGGAAGNTGTASEASEVIILDVSGSMTGTKIAEARRAATVAIDGIRDGTFFAVVAGNHEARSVYPSTGLALADRRTRADAVKEVKKMKAGGGTAMGQWVRATTDLLQGQAGIRHAILLTDGRNESEEASELETALDDASGVFQCDCRGVGTGWEVDELRTVAHALLGTVDMVADPNHLAADFDAMIRQAMGKSLADVSIRVWTPKGSEVGFLKQVAPDILDLTDSRAAADALSGDFPTGAWGNESRDYHLNVRVRPGAVGEKMLAARVSMVVDGQACQQSQVAVTWTDEMELSTRINRQVAHYTGQQELADAIQEGLQARQDGDEDTARVKLGRAVQLAASAGVQEKIDLLAKVVDIDDAPTGQVHLKKSVNAEDELMLNTRSTRTARVRR